MTELVIVCEDKFKVYGDYLSQLVSSFDDGEEKPVGTKDGEVVAVVWTEKEYEHNKVDFSSNQNVVFIGNKKLVKEKSKFMKEVFKGYGMCYSRLGKQAVLTVNKTVEEDDYNAFIEYAKKYQDNIECLVKDKPKKINAANAIAERFAFLPSIGDHKFKYLTLKNKVQEQQYGCLITLFYLNYLSEFIND